MGNSFGLETIWQICFFGLEAIWQICLVFRTWGIKSVVIFVIGRQILFDNICILCHKFCELHCYKNYKSDDATYIGRNNLLTGGNSSFFLSLSLPTPKCCFTFVFNTVNNIDRVSYQVYDTQLQKNEKSPNLLTFIFLGHKGPFVSSFLRSSVSLCKWSPRVILFCVSDVCDNVTLWHIALCVS